MTAWCWLGLFFAAGPLMSVGWAACYLWRKRSQDRIRENLNRRERNLSLAEQRVKQAADALRPFS